MMYDFDISRANLVLEGLHDLEQKYIIAIQTAAARDDMDTAADFGNDLTRLQILREGFEHKAVEAFGPQVADTQGQPLAPTAGVNGALIEPR